MRLIDADALMKLAKDVTLENGVKHRCIDATMIHELPTIEHGKGRWNGDEYEIAMYDIEKIAKDLYEKVVPVIVSLVSSKQPRVLEFEELDRLPEGSDVWCQVRDTGYVYATTVTEGWLSPGSARLERIINNEIRYWSARPAKIHMIDVPWGDEV